MNKVILMGRLARDPEIRTTQSGLAVCNFTVACDRRIKTDAGTWDKTADFIPCVAWRQQAEFVNRYFSKGDRILVSGSIQPRSWEDDDGNKRYATDIQVQEVEFCESNAAKEGSGHRNNYAKPAAQSEYLDPLASDDDTALPFDF